jgi:hypothetical protein
MPSSGAWSERKYGWTPPVQKQSTIEPRFLFPGWSLHHHGGVCQWSGGPWQRCWSRASTSRRTRGGIVVVLRPVDLHRRPTGKAPPGGPRLCRFMRFYLCGGFVRNIHFPCYHQRRQRLQHQIPTISGHAPQFVKPEYPILPQQQWPTSEGGPLSF